MASHLVVTPSPRACRGGSQVHCGGGSADGGSSRAGADGGTMLRRTLIVGLVWVLALGVPAALAEVAIGPFHAPVAVVRAGCSFQEAHGDAVVGRDGVTRGFISFTG